MEGSGGVRKGQKAEFKRGRPARPGRPQGLDSTGPLNFLSVGRCTELPGLLPALFTLA